jgi:hypothetical protein
MRSESCAATVDEAIVLLVDLLLDPLDAKSKLRAINAKPDTVIMLLALFTQIANGTALAVAGMTDSEYVDGVSLIVRVARDEMTRQLHTDSDHTIN